METFRFKVGLNSTEHTQKPAGKQVGLINRNGFPTTEVSLEELKTSLSKGMTFTPSYLTGGKRSNENFEGSYVFALDFDDNQNPEDKIAQLKEYGIETNLYYPSFSDTPQHRKFRIVIVFDTPIEDRKLRDKIQLAIMEIVKDSDAACKDASRMFYGGSTCDLLCNTPNSLEESLIHLHNIINSLTTNKGTKVRNDKLTKNGTKTLLPYYIIRDYQKSTINATEYDIKQHYDYEQAKENSKVFKHFAEGGHLKYAQMFNLISNMQYVKGGLKWVKEVMDKAGSYNYSDYELLRTIKHYNYLPSNIDTFDSELIGEYSNIWHLDRTSNSVEVIQKAEKYDSDMLYSKFSQFLETINNRDMLKANYNIKTERINICSVGVGIGKSHKLKKQLRDGKTVFAFPTHDLKKEFEQDIQKYNVSYVATPEIPQFNIKEINTMYDNYQAMGDSLKANKLIKDISLGKAKDMVSEELILASNFDYQTDIRLAKNYLDEMAKAYASEHCVLTTHQRALLTPESFKNKEHFVFDEDIIDSLLPIETIKTSQIVNVINKVQSKRKVVKDDLQAICDHLNTLTASAIVKTEDVVIRDLNALKKALSIVKGGAKIIKFLESDFVLRYKGGDDVDNFYCIAKKSLPTDKQITIASATADEYFYDRLLANEDYKFHLLGNAKNNNNIIQYTGKRYSRYALSNGDIPEIDEGSVVITYKNNKDKFENYDDIVHFGNAEGYNHLKGKDLAIVGTPTRPVHIVMLYAKALGMEWETKDLGFEKQTIIYKGQGNIWKYSVHSYGDEGLANIDIRLAIKDLEQSVGRARANRTESNVEVFSAIPTYSADEFKLRK
ncbi:hypothetical protein OAF78_00310 [Winogradskyella sp.]|nr:hypothetical protein [Winogradskyella sp.]MDB4752192.1 hypothetical protein [Winogradskyella sp.]